MSKGLVAMQHIIINAPVAKVWEALIDPSMIKQYLFGTQVVSNWKKGSRIVYKGVWKGNTYEDKGTILNIVPGKLLETDFWSSLEGLPDLPENYRKVIYELKPVKDGTQFTVTQDNNNTEEGKTHSEENWRMVLEGLKKLLEQ